jgi:hypothetical protein
LGLGAQDACAHLLGVAFRLTCHLPMTMAAQSDDISEERVQKQKETQEHSGDNRKQEVSLRFQEYCPFCFLIK